MKQHLMYVEPTRSVAGAWKHCGGVRFALRRAHLKKLGAQMAKGGVMHKPLVPVKVAAACMEAMNLGLGEAWHYDTHIMMAGLLGEEWAAAMRVAAKKFQGSDEEGIRWEPVAWSGVSWWVSSPYSLIHHLHQSTENPANVAYAEGLRKMQAERYTSTKAGRYLTKYFPELGEAKIKEWAERQAARACPAELKFIEGTDKDGWVRVYKDGPASCMQGEDCVEVYAHEKSVLRLAYLAQGDEIHARCIVRDDKKEWIRCYPNTSSTEGQRWHTAMEAAVEGAGYTHGNFYGVHLDKVRHPDAGRHDNKWMMPYLDSGSGRRCDTYVDDAGATLVVGSDGIEAQQQDGYVDFDNQQTCDECGSRMDEDTSCYVEGEEISVCEHCYQTEFVTALSRRGHERTVRNSDAIEVGCEWYHTEYLSDNDIYQCEDDGEYYHMDDLCYTSRGFVHSDRVTALDEEDSDGNSYAHDDDIATTHDGRTIHEDDVVTETINGVDVVFHKDDDIDAYKEEHKEEKEEA